VSIDGKDWEDLTALSVSLDPGPHRFVFHRGGSPDVEQQVLLREGGKSREVTGVFALPDAHAEPASVAVTTRPVPVAVWLTAGLGAAGLASFAAFGTVGLLERSSDHCATACTTADKDSVDTKFRVADISLGVSVVAFGAATWIFLARPAIQMPQAAFFDIRPMPGGGLAVVGAPF
jgi:hypothetical protein